MNIMKELHDRLMRKHGQSIDLKKGPDVLTDIIDELSRVMQSGQVGQKESIAPFGVSWMDSWVAHWVYYDQLQTIERQNNELARVLKGLVDLKFRERLSEIQRYIREHEGIFQEPPDGGPPEPGTPPAGPQAKGIFAQAPDGGPPEPGTPPAGPRAKGIFAELPDGGPPEPGVPPDPPAGPDAGFLVENPWILYWFVSVKAPMLLDVIDAHITQRLEQLQQSVRG